MTINLHNYEEYFLLYADKELSGEERESVEDFVKQHPELEGEFEMINSTIMEPETFELKDKSFLLKSSEKEFINNANYEEIFILYHDGELNEEQKNKTTGFLEKHPQLNDEFLLFARARLHAESISFPDKKSLLRKKPSGITGRVILFRSLAAAAVLAFGLWVSIPYLLESEPANQLAGQIKTSDSPVQGNSAAAVNTTETKNHLAANEPGQISSETQGFSTQPESAYISEEPKDVPVNKKEMLLAKSDKDRSSSPVQEKITQQLNPEKKEKKVYEVMTAQIPPLEISAGETIHRDDLAIVDVDITPDMVESNQTAQRVVYLDVDKEPSGNYIFYNVPEEEFRKTKIGGFLKKLKRVAERNDPIRRLFEGETGQVASNN